MEEGDEKKFLCRTCGEHHQTLRLSLKKRTKKCFSRSKKRLEEAVGPSSEDWLQNATLQRLEVRKREEERDLFISPQSQCSSQLTPDILKFHRGRTFESSPEVSTFERLLSSQSTTSSPQADWLQPSLGLSPQGVDSGALSHTITSEDALIRSLGITADDSVASWTSSLATPSHLTMSTDVKRDSCEKEYIDAGKQKRVPRALFSPGLGKGQDELCCSFNESELKSESKEAIGSKQEITELVDIPMKSEPTELESLPIFSQELLHEESNMVDNILPSKNEKSLSSIEKDCNSLVEPKAVTIKQEVIDETLSDFFDPPSKSVGKRRCAPNRGQKRKSLEDSTGNVSITLGGEAKNSSMLLSPPVKAVKNMCNTEMYKTPMVSNKEVKSILSNEKKRTRRSSTRKRVTFSHTDDNVKESNSVNEVSAENNDLGKERKEDLPGQSSEQSSLEGSSHLKLRKEFISLAQANDQSAETSEDADDLFSQVSPSSLNEMCSLNNENLFTFDENKRHPNALLNKFNKSPKITPDIQKEQVTRDKEQCKTKSEDTEQEYKLLNSKPEEIPVSSNLSSFRFKNRKFLYPTNNQITKSCPKTVYGFKEVEPPFQSQHISDEHDENALAIQQDKAAMSQKLEIGASRMAENKSPKASSTQGFQKFSSLQTVVKKEDYLKDVSFSVKNVKEECQIMQKCTSVKSEEVSALPGTNCEKNVNIRSTISHADKPSRDSYHYTKPSNLPCHIASNVKPATDTFWKPPEIFEGFCTAGGKKFSQTKDALQKARAMLEMDTDNVGEITEQKETHPEKAFTNKLDLIHSQDKTFEHFQEEKMELFTECDAGFQGFQTASGKKVKLSESSLRKAQMIISGEGDAKEFPDTGCDNNASEIVPSGDREGAGLNTVSHFKGFSSANCLHLREGSTKTEASSRNVDVGNLKGKGKNIFSDIFEEFQVSGNLDSDSFSGFNTAGGKGFCSVKIGPTGSKPVCTKMEGMEENSADIDEEEIIQTLFSGIKNKGITDHKAKMTSSFPIKPQKVDKPMKSSSIAAKFPPGSNIPKGFRPFKPPQILVKPKSNDSIHKASNIVNNLKLDETESETSCKNKLHINELAKSTTQTESCERKTDEDNNTKETDAVKPDDSADLSNLFLNDMFEEEMEISQKLTPNAADRKICVSDENESKVSVERKEEEASTPSSCDELKDSTELVNKQVVESSAGMTKPSFSGFQTASGKTVSVDDKSLKKARELWENQKDETADKFDDLDPEIIFKDKEININNFHFSNSCKNDFEGKNVNLGQRIEKNVYETNEISSAGTSSAVEDRGCAVIEEFKGFQTASGKSVSVDKQSLSVAKELWEKSLEEDCQKPVHSNDKSETFQGFHTASSKTVSICDKSILEAQKIWEKSHDVHSPSKNTDKTSGMKNPWGETANLNISKSALSEAKKLLENSSAVDAQTSISPCDITRSEPNQDKLSFNGFQTASGKTVEVDEKSVAEARKLWTSSSDENNKNFPHSLLENLFYHDNFSQTIKDTNCPKNQISVGTLKETSENIQDVPESNDPKSAAKFPNIPQKLQSKSGKENECIQSSVSVSPFISASGKSIHVSNEALVHVKYELNKLSDGEQNTKALDKNEDAKTSEQPSASSVGCPFMSASGKQISVSAAALESTKSFFSEGDDEVGHITTERKNFSPFQSASGKSVSFSQKSLEMARAGFADNHKMETSNASSTFVETRLKEKPFSPLQSASGKSISVLQKSLDMVRSKLAENCETVSKEQTSTPKILNNGKIHPDISPFQSASGKSIAVSKESLEMARARLEENIEANVDKPTTQGNDGSSVVSRINTQKRKLEEVETPKRTRNRNVGDPREYDNLVLPDDFFDEMETPNKKIKMDSDGESDQKPGDIITDRKTNLTALSTVPEGYTKDRSSFYTKPLKCENVIDAQMRNAQMKTEEAKKHTTHASAVPGSAFRTPYKAGMSSINTQHNTVVKSVQPVFVPKTKSCGQSLPSPSMDKTVNVASTQQPSSSEQTIPNRNAGANKEGYLGTLDTAVKKQEEIIKSKASGSVKPSVGRQFQLKSSGQRVKLREVITRCQGNTCLDSVSPTTCSVRACSAAKHKFYLPDFYGSDVTQVYVGDGALLVPDEKGCTGVKEMYKAFLTIDSVDCSLINEAWFCNHYRWIVWKLASYEVASPEKFGGRALTPENVMLQMKYRYDREIDRCQRSALRKIMERDDTSTKRMVLCVSGIWREQQSRASTPSCNQQVPMETEVTVELTDGWYCIPSKLDAPLLDLVNKKRIRTGHKLCTSGAELVGSQDPCTPLEAPASLQLKINFNSTRPAPWDTMLGFQVEPRPLCVPLSDLNGEGGMVGCIDVVLGRKYPLMYMEKLPGGGSVFRTAQAEEKFSQLHQKQEQEAKEALYRKLETKFDKDDYEESCAVKRQWSKGEIEDLQCGQEVWEALRTAKRPEIVEGYLSDSQLRTLMDYKQELHQEKLQRLQNEFQKSWSDEQGDTKSRNVVPLLKLRVVGLSKKDVDFKISTIISVWRPGQDVMELKEGQRYRVFCLSATQSRTKFSQYSVQLTATRQTKFLPVNVDENLLDMVFEPREVLCACDLKRRQPVFGELDIVCFIVSIEAAEVNERNQEVVYGMDKNGDIIGIKFWGGLKAFGMNGTLTVGALFCGSNIQDKFPYRSAILPVVDASLEFSVFTKSPQGPTHRNAYQILTERIKTSGEKTLVERGQQLVTELLEKKKNRTLGHTPTKNLMLESAEPQSVADSPHPQHLVHQAKMARLMSYGSPSPLSPIPTKVTPSARRGFKIPKPADV